MEAAAHGHSTLGIPKSVGKEFSEADKGHHFKDSPDLAEAWQAAIAMGEIIAPGLKLPTFDSASPHQVTLDSICTHKRRVLANALHNENRCDIVVEHMPDRATPLHQMTCDGIAVLFHNVGNAVRAKNALVPRTLQKSAVKQPAVTPADINAANAAFWAKHH